MTEFTVHAEVERIYTYATTVEAETREEAHRIVDKRLDESGVDGMVLVDEHTWSMDIASEDDE